jgi:hypothetical protein
MRGSYALYQGTTLVGPLTAERELGFSPCGSTASAVTVTSGLADQPAVAPMISNRALPWLPKKSSNALDEAPKPYYCGNSHYHQSRLA